MNATVCISSTDQDTTLGVALDAAFKNAGWKACETVPFTYGKNFADLDEEQTYSHSKLQIEDTIVEADWYKVKYLLVISAKPGTELSYN